MRKISIIIIISTVIILSLYDIYAALYGGIGSTFSEIIRQAAYNAPIIPFAFGVVCGHWFWNTK